MAFEIAKTALVATLALARCLLILCTQLAGTDNPPPDATVLQSAQAPGLQVTAEQTRR